MRRWAKGGRGVVAGTALLVVGCSTEIADQRPATPDSAQGEDAGGGGGAGGGAAIDAPIGNRDSAPVGGTGGLTGGTGGTGGNGTGGAVGTGGTGTGGTGGNGTGGAVGTGGTGTGGTPGAGGAVACATNPQGIYDDIAYLASPELRGRMPGDVGNRLAVDFAQESFQASRLLPAGDAGTYRQAFNFNSSSKADNVLGKIVGVDPALTKEVIVVGAHIDHIGVNADGSINYGADDNASGTAIVMELARMFDRCGVRPKRTVLFVEFNAEEMGLLGSTFYVANPTLPLVDTIAMYNFDMVGSGDGTGVLLFGGNDVANRWLTDLMINGAKIDGLTHVIQLVPQKLASDHAPFVRKGIPICWGFSRPDPHPGYHTPGDTMSKIKLQSLKAVSELFWASLRRLALGEGQRPTQLELQQLLELAPESVTESAAPMHLCGTH